MLESTRLLTLTGTGGVGKTRLAIEAARTIWTEYVDGVWLIELAPLADSRLVPQAVAAVLGVREQPGQGLLTTLADVLHSRSVLIVLDNCEHVLQGCIDLVASLLQASAGCHLLATSREALGIAGETNFLVPPLSLSQPQRPELAGTLAQSEAVRLFTDRASAASHGFALTDQNAQAVAQICRRLDGIPLAIELAAARVRVLSPQEIAVRLDDRFRLLVAGSRTAPPRHQTLAATVNWSYELLSDDERRLFERLSVFAGGFDLDGAESACCDEDGPGPPQSAPTSKAIAASAILDLLSRLVDQSLVVVDADDAGERTRYRLLETMRAYGWQRLVDRGESDGVGARHAAWVLQLGLTADRNFHGPQQGRWLKWAAREEDNVRTALHWFIERGEAEAALQLSGSLAWAWLQRGRWTESKTWLERALAMPGATARTYGRAKALGAAGAQAVMGGRDFNAGRPMVQESLAIGLELGVQDVVVWARAVLALVGGLRGDIGLMELEEFALETLATARQSGDSWGENRVLMGLAMLALKQGNVELAIARLEAAIGVARAASDTWSLATTLMGLGDVERSRGGHVRAGALYEESAAVFAGLDLGEHPLEFPHILHNLGYVALAAGATPTARDHFVQAISAYRQIGDKPGVAECVVGLAAVAAAHGRSENAARLFGMAEVAFEAVGAQLWYTNRGDYERWVAVARAGLESTAFAAAWAEGRAVRFDQAIERALESER